MSVGAAGAPRREWLVQMEALPETQEGDPGGRAALGRWGTASPRVLARRGRGAASSRPPSRGHGRAERGTGPCPPRGPGQPLPGRPRTGPLRPGALPVCGGRGGAAARALQSCVGLADTSCSAERGGGADFTGPGGPRPPGHPARAPQPIAGRGSRGRGRAADSGLHAAAPACF